MVDIEIVSKLVLACVLGGVIGYERQARRKSAGLRTNILVCLGSCLVMILSMDLYKSVEGYTNADPARLAAQVVSGIGFLGAGAIMKEGVNVTGLTTAACLWVVAGVGLAVGMGHYSGAIITSLLVFLTIKVLHYIEVKRFSKDKIMYMSLLVENHREALPQIITCLTNYGMDVSNISIEEEPGDVLNAEQEENPTLYARIDLKLHNRKKQKKVDIVQALERMTYIHGVNLK